MITPGMTYLLWALGWFGFCGIHRFCVGKPLTGLLWFFTGGLCLVGQIIDVFLIPGMVEQANHRFLGGPRHWA